MKPHIIIIGEHTDNHIAPITFELIAFAKILQQRAHAGIHLFLAGRGLVNVANRLAETESIDVTLMEPDTTTISTGTEPAPIDLVFKNLPIALILGLNPVYVCMGHTPTGTDFAPALAILLNAACITGVERVVTCGNDLCFVRSVFNDKITAAILPTAKIIVLTLLPGSFKPEPTLPGKSGTVSIRNICIDNFTDESDARGHYAFHGFKKNDADTSALNNADVIVSAGNGVKKQEHIELINQLARIFSKSAVAGSRPICDKKWLTYSQQVGITGASVKPKLYLACGISGASQHTAGMRDARFIAAINSDPHAAIFNISDVCIIEDLTTFIPRLIMQAHATAETGA